MKKQGIILVAIGHQAYAYAAANMAVSIKHHSQGVPITLLCDKHYEWIHDEDRNAFDSVVALSDEEIYTNGKLDPAKVKVNLYDHLPYKYNLYLDVDGYCIAPIEPFIEALIADGRHFQCTVVDSGKHDNEDIAYSVWAKTADIVDRFKVPKKNDITAIQSSWLFIIKGTESKEFYTRLSREYDEGFDVHELKEKWGGGLPDELFYSGVISAMGIDVAPVVQPVYFGDARPRLTIAEASTKHAVISLFGNGNGRTKTPLQYWDAYDQYMRRYCRESGRKWKYKGDFIKKFKHANNTR